MTRYRIVHTTEYRFDKEAWDFNLIARLKPVDGSGQHCDYFQIVSRPPGRLQPMAVDAFGNCVHRLRIERRLQRLYISAISTVTRTDRREENRVDLNHGRQSGDSNFSPPKRSLFLAATRLTPLSDPIRAYASQLGDPGKSIVVQAEALNRGIHADMTFAAGVTTDQTNAAEVLASRRGVCQDFSHLAIACARSLGWAARYVSGYVYTAAFRGKGHRIASDASHAWFDVFDPMTGWRGFDPANNRRVDGNYIVVARGRDYNDACPLQGTFQGGGVHRLDVSVDVQQIG